jgi:hypothetical protein
VISSFLFSRGKTSSRRRSDDAALSSADFQCNPGDLRHFARVHETLVACGEDCLKEEIFNFLKIEESVNPRSEASIAHRSSSNIDFVASFHEEPTLPSETSEYKTQRVCVIKFNPVSVRWESFESRLRGFSDHRCGL